MATLWTGPMRSYRTRTQAFGKRQGWKHALRLVGLMLLAAVAIWLWMIAVMLMG